jgi:hypothetical protein
MRSSILDPLLELTCGNVVESLALLELFDLVEGREDVSFETLFVLLALSFVFVYCQIPGMG